MQNKMERKSIESFLADTDKDLLQYAPDMRRNGFTSTNRAKPLLMGGEALNFGYQNI